MQVTSSLEAVATAVESQHQRNTNNQNNQNNQLSASTTSVGETTTNNSTEKQTASGRNIFYNFFSISFDKNSFPSQSLKILTFRVKLSDSIFFLLGLSPIVKLI